MFKLVGLCIALLLLQGCSARTVYTYDQTPLTASNEAILDCAEGVEIDTFDESHKIYTSAGVGMYYGGCDVHMLPGKHSVVIDYTDSTTHLRKPITLSFVAKAGKKYKINATRHGSSSISLSIDEVGDLNQTK